MLCEPGNIDLWWGSLSDLAPHHDYYLGVLSEEEKSKVQACQSFESSRTFALIRGWVRTALATYTGDDPTQLQIGYEPHGKPVLIQVPTARSSGRSPRDRWEFNVSHSAEHFVFAVTRGSRLGVDLERIRSIDDMETIARKYFSKADCEALCQVKKGRDQLFFELWTQLKAWYKVFGTKDLSVKKQPYFSRTWESAPGYVATVISEREDSTICWLSWKGSPVER